VKKAAGKNRFQYDVIHDVIESAKTKEQKNEKK